MNRGRTSWIVAFAVINSVCLLHAKPSPIAETASAVLGVGGVGISSRLVYVTYYAQKNGYKEGVYPRAMFALSFIVITKKLLDYGFKEDSFPRFLLKRL